MNIELWRCSLRRRGEIMLDFTLGNDQAILPLLHPPDVSLGWHANWTRLPRPDSITIHYFLFAFWYSSSA